MSITLRLVLAFTAVAIVVFGAVGLAAVRSSGDTVERGLERRIDATVAIVGDRPAFFLFEAARRSREFRQLADISGFEIVAPPPGGTEPAASSLPPEATREFLAAVPDAERFETTVDGVGYRGARAVVAGRTLYLLAPVAAIERAKAEAGRPVLVASLIGLVATALLGALIAGTVTRPIRRLAERVSEVREGSLGIELPRGGGREVASLGRSFEAMLVRLAEYREELVRREKMATLGQFSAAVAHELRNPLSSMRMTLEMMLPEAPARMREDLETMLSEMARLDHSVEELLFHAGTPRYVMGETDLAEAVRATVRILRPLADHLGVALVEEADAAPVTGDRTRLKQAVMNLVLNAIHAAGADGRVEVRTTRAGADAVVEVGDTGPGVPEEIAERLYEPFVSGREGGTGLGLAVTHAIAAAHGGGLAHERRGDRTVFCLSIPGR